MLYLKFNLLYLLYQEKKKTKNRNKFSRKINEIKNNIMSQTDPESEGNSNIIS